MKRKRFKVEQLVAVLESLHEAQEQIEAWRQEYNATRPHRVLQDRTPLEFAKAVAEHLLRETVVTAGNSP